MHAQGIYQILCIASKNSYIGSSKDIQRRWHLHRCDLRHQRHHSLVLQRAYNKYGLDGFTWIILEIVDDYSIIHEREQYWIDEIKPKYNRTLTVNQHCLGRKNGPPTEETKEKIRQKVTGFRHTAETKALMSSVSKGKKKNLSPEQRIARREQTRLINIGRKAGLETRLKISAFMKTRPVKPETIEKRRVKLTGKPWTPARREAQKTAQYPVHRKPRDLTTYPRGENQVNAKLTNAQVEEMRRLYVPGKFGYKRLANLFGVSPQYVREIVQGRARL